MSVVSNRNKKEYTDQRILLPEPAIVQDSIRGIWWKEARTNVFRESKAVILLTSTLERCCLQKTKMQFSCDEYCMRCYDSLRDPVGRAICECCLAIGSLKGCVRPHTQH